MSRPKDSNIRKCFDYMKSSVSKSTMNLHWYRDTYAVLSKYDCHEVLEQEMIMGGDYNLSAVGSLILSKIENVHENYVQSMIVLMQACRKMQYYRNIKIYCAVDPIMNSNLNWNLVCLLVQLKSNIPRGNVKNKLVNLNAFNVLLVNIAITMTIHVKFVALTLKKTLYHLLYVCPAYSFSRDDVYEVLKKANKKEESVLQMKYVNTELLRNWSIYIEKAVNLREDWINLYS
jgi:hypothetical protein